jgi:hemolysin activation/secretion protein
MKPNRTLVRSRLPVQALSSLSILCTLSAPAAAQIQTPNYGIGDAVRDTRPAAAPSPNHTPPAALPERREQPLNLPSTDTLRIDLFRFEGADFLPEAELQAIVAPYKGRALSLEQIQEAARKIGECYRERGYPVARAYVPQQDASRGELTLRVVVGRYGSFHIDNQSLVGDHILRREFDPLLAEPALSFGRLERATLIVRDMPGTGQSTLVVSPGKESGTSDIEVLVPPAPRATASLRADNLDSNLVGRNRISAAVNVNSPLGIADALAVKLDRTQQGGLLAGTLSYDFPLAADGLRGELQLSKVRYEIGDEFAELGIHGTSNGAAAGLHYPLLRSREHSSYLRFALSTGLLRDDIDFLLSSQAKHQHQAELSLEDERYGQLAGKEAGLKLQMRINYGHIRLDDAAAAELDRLGAHTAGNYSVVNLYTQGFVNLGPRWSVSGALSMQKALGDKALEGTVKMVTAGRSGVKAYREASSGDNGYLAVLESRWQLPSPTATLNHSLSMYAEASRVFQNKALYGRHNGTRLADVALGYAASYKALRASVQLARAVGTGPEAYNGSRQRLLVDIGLIF